MSKDLRAGIEADRRSSSWTRDETQGGDRMTATRTITHLAERQVGDHYVVKFDDGWVLTGVAHGDGGRVPGERLLVGDMIVRLYGAHVDVFPRVVSVVVTRNVEIPPEPMKFAAAVELGNGRSALRCGMDVGGKPWLIPLMGWFSWDNLVSHEGVTRVKFEGVDL